MPQTKRGAEHREIIRRISCPPGAHSLVEETDVYTECSAKSTTLSKWRDIITFPKAGFSNGIVCTDYLRTVHRQIVILCIGGGGTEIPHV